MISKGIEEALLTLNKYSLLLPLMGGPGSGDTGSGFQGLSLCHSHTSGILASPLQNGITVALLFASKRCFLCKNSNCGGKSYSKNYGLIGYSSSNMISSTKEEDKLATSKKKLTLTHAVHQCTQEGHTKVQVVFYCNIDLWAAYLHNRNSSSALLKNFCFRKLGGSLKILITLVFLGFVFLCLFSGHIYPGHPDI